MNKTEGGGAFNESGGWGKDITCHEGLGVGGHPCIIDMFKKICFKIKLKKLWFTILVYSY